MTKEAIFNNLTLCKDIIKDMQDSINKLKPSNQDRLDDYITLQKNLSELDTVIHLTHRDVKADLDDLTFFNYIS